jgi:alanyl-tRNA synthetase
MNIKIATVTAIGCLITGFVAGCIVTDWRLSASAAKEKAEAVQANADYFRDATKKVNENATEHVKKSEQLKKQITELKKELAHVQKNRPVVDNCRPDADRLRVLQSAVDAANTAIGQ